MLFTLWFLFVIIFHFTGANQVTISSSFKMNRNFHSIPIKYNSSEVHLRWFLSSPWKVRNDSFNDKPYNNSVEYFHIQTDDLVTNQSYLESSKISVCNEILLTFYLKINRLKENVKIILFVYKENLWNNVWEYRDNNSSQWQFHQVQINMTNYNEDVQFRFLPISACGSRFSTAIAILNISTHTNCENKKSQMKSGLSMERRSSFIYVVLGSIFSAVFIAIFLLFIYGLIEKQCRKLTRFRSTRRRRKARRTRNAVRDESSVISIPTNIV